MSTIHVRPIAVADQAAWLELWAGYNTFYEAVVPPEVTACTWNRFLDPQVPMHALVAEADGVVLGFASYVLHLSTYSIAPVCYLEDLFTAPAARGRGVGRALIEGVADAARAVHATRLYWVTADTNATAQALYDRVAQRTGFVQYRKGLA